MTRVMSSGWARRQPVINSAKYSMLLDSFLELAKQQDQSIIDGAVMVFIPRDGMSKDASLFVWLSDSSEKTQANIWHDTFVAMLFALLKNGVDKEILHELVDFADNNADGMSATVTDATAEDLGEPN